MSMNRVSALLGAVCLTLLTGCTFCCLQGNGPTSRANLSSYLQPADAQQVEQWKREVNSLKFPWGPRSQKISYGPFSGYTSHVGQTLNWHILAGPSHQRFLYEPSNTEERTVVSTTDVWGILFPLYSNWNSAFYDSPTGECLSTGHMTTLTLFIVYGSATAPAGKGKDMSPEYLVRKTDLREIKYDRMSGCCLAFGALAWGQKNDRAYFQLAWIPIPLWSL